LSGRRRGALIDDGENTYGGTVVTNPSSGLLSKREGDMSAEAIAAEFAVRLTKGLAKKQVRKKTSFVSAKNKRSG
jgi:hypothetical protein